MSVSVGQTEGLQGRAPGGIALDDGLSSSTCTNCTKARELVDEALAALACGDEAEVHELLELARAATCGEVAEPDASESDIS